MNRRQKDRVGVVHITLPNNTYNVCIKYNYSASYMAAELYMTIDIPVSAKLYTRA